MIGRVRDRILHMLKESFDEWVTNTAIEEELHITRETIWKNIASLKEEGYAIEGNAKKDGYRLTGIPDLLLPPEVRTALTTTCLGKGDIYYSPVMSSTNDEAKRLAEAGVHEGTLIIAEKQTRGKGRLGRSWFSADPGGIYLSLILRPRLSPADVSGITLMTGLALAEAIGPVTGLDARIKWPNDILINGKKVAGILTEMGATADLIQYIIVGVGINVNSDAEHFPDDLRPIATSLSREAGKRFSRLQVLRAFLEKLETRYLEFQGSGFAPIVDAWKRTSGIIGRNVSVDMISETVEGTVVDIDDRGALLVRDRQDRTHRIISGDVTIVPGERSAPSA